ncbi:MAG: type II secretion system protein [Planctomycetota bacterium]
MQRSRQNQAAFTLVELMVVIGIIALLVGILVPTVSRVRESAQVAATASLIQQLSGAAEAYAVDLGGYPGPIPNRLIGTGVTNPVFGQPATTNPTFLYEGDIPPTTGARGITGTENLVLGLLGGAMPDGTYQPDTVGQGPIELRGTRLDKRFSPYFNPQPNDLSWIDEGGGLNGRFVDVAGQKIDDTIIPEFVDRFADPLPILYLRANRGTSVSVSDATELADGDASDPLGQYDLSQVFIYTGSPITAAGDKPDKSADTTHGLRSLVNPADRAGVVDSLLIDDKTYGFTAYFGNPEIAGQPRQKDGFILISAGRDRIYGTRDDITNFGGI